MGPISDCILPHAFFVFLCQGVDQAKLDDLRRFVEPIPTLGDDLSGSSFVEVTAGAGASAGLSTAAAFGVAMEAETTIDLAALLGNKAKASTEITDDHIEAMLHQVLPEMVAAEHQDADELFDLHNDVGTESLEEEYDLDAFIEVSANVAPSFVETETETETEAEAEADAQLAADIAGLNELAADADVDLESMLDAELDEVAGAKNALASAFSAVDAELAAAAKTDARADAKAGAAKHATAPQAGSLLEAAADDVTFPLEPPVATPATMVSAADAAAALSSAKRGYEVSNWAGNPISPMSPLSQLSFAPGANAQPVPAGYAITGASTINPYWNPQHRYNFNPYVPFSFGVGAPAFGPIAAGQAHPALGYAAHAPGPADVAVLAGPSTTVANAFVETETEQETEAETESEESEELTAEEQAAVEAQVAAEEGAEAEGEIAALIAAEERAEEQTEEQAETETETETETEAAPAAAVDAEEEPFAFAETESAAAATASASASTSTGAGAYADMDLEAEAEDAAATVAALLSAGETDAAAPAPVAAASASPVAAVEGAAAVRSDAEFDEAMDSELDSFEATAVAAEAAAASFIEVEAEPAAAANAIAAANATAPVNGTAPAANATAPAANGTVTANATVPAANGTVAANATVAANGTAANATTAVNGTAAVRNATADAEAVVAALKSISAPLSTPRPPVPVFVANATAAGNGTLAANGTTANGTLAGNGTATGNGTLSANATAPVSNRTTPVHALEEWGLDEAEAEHVRESLGEPLNPDLEPIIDDFHSDEELPPRNPPNATVPNATTPNATTPNATTPNATTPNATVPNATVPVPNATAPNGTVVLPNGTAPNGTAPNTTVPVPPKPEEPEEEEEEEDDEDKEEEPKPEPETEEERIRKHLETTFEPDYQPNRVPKFYPLYSKQNGYDADISEEANKAAMRRVKPRLFRTPESKPWRRPTWRRTTDALPPAHLKAALAPVHEEQPRYRPANQEPVSDEDALETKAEEMDKTIKLLTETKVHENGQTALQRMQHTQGRRGIKASIKYEKLKAEPFVPAFDYAY
jgi:hypothetical protein